MEVDMINVATKPLRLIVTDKCNIACDYCLMKNKEITDTYKSLTKSQALNFIYDKSFLISYIAITGGEPMKVPYQVKHLLEEIKSINVYHLPIYLYTNGYYLTKEFVKSVDNYIDGISVSIHDIDDFMSYLGRMRDINTIKPIRFSIQSTKKNYIEIIEKMIGNFPVAFWTKDECNDNEFRIKIEEPKIITNN